MITLARIPIRNACNGYYLRWYYNGWHYWLFKAGTLGYNTAGEPYRTTGARTVELSSAMVTADEVEAIRTILNTAEVYVYTDGGWCEIRVLSGEALVLQNYLNAYSVELKAILGSRKLSATGFSPVGAIPAAPMPVYCEVTIGTQIWMCQNWDAAYPASKVYGNDEANRALYGGLYTWAQVNGAGFCPAGWHVPTATEWQTLIDYIGGDAVAGGKLKAIGTTYWNAPNTGATDDYSFDARGGGAFGFFSGVFTNLKTQGNFWTASPYTPIANYAYYARMRNDAATCSLLNNNQNQSYSVRLLKNTPAVPPVASDWIEIPQTLSNKLYAVKTVDMNTIFVVGTNIIASSVDGGVIWTEQTKPSVTLPVEIYGVSFIDANTGWVCGVDGDTIPVMWNTVNGGTTWNAQTLPFTSGVLNSVIFVDALVGWAVGIDYDTDAIIVYTDDGGTTWNVQTTPSDNILWGVTAISDQIAWACGVNSSTESVVVLTVDGGTNWTLASGGTIPSIELRSISFFDDTIGWAAGDDGSVFSILYTDDGGENWVEQMNTISGVMFSVQAVDNLIAVACGFDFINAPLMYRTDDGGTTWLPQTVETTDGQLRGINMVDEGNGLSVGYSSTNAPIILTYIT